MLIRFFMSLMVSILLLGCAQRQKESQFFVSFSPNVLVANVGEQGKAAATLYFNSSIQEAVHIGALEAPFAIQHNTCSGPMKSRRCAITISYSPLSDKDYGKSQKVQLAYRNQERYLVLEGRAASLSVPLQNGVADGEAYVDLNVAGGPSIQAAIDLHSAFLVIERSAVGRDVIDTQVPYSVQYNDNMPAVSGYLAYGTVQFAAHAVLVTTKEVPLLVVADGSLGTKENKVKAIIGMSGNNQISARLFLPAPYTFAFELDAIHQKLSFGNLHLVDEQKKRLVQLNPSSCVSTVAKGNTSFLCYDTSVLPKSWRHIYLSQEQGHYLIY